MRLLNLSSYVQKKIVSGKISQGHAKILVGLDEKRQKIVIDSIIGQKLSVRDAEKMVKRYKESDTAVIAVPKTGLLDPYTKELEALLPFEYKIKAKSIEISLTNEKDIKDFLIFLKKH
jgi:ParB family chromosome partitioning protein